MYRTFNMGIGLVIITRPSRAKRIQGYFKGSKIIGVVKKGKKGVSLI